jgi:hypothetical protein
VIKKAIILFFLATFVVLLPGVSQSAVFNVNSAAGLQQALTDAQTNGQDDIIKVQQGVYAGNFEFSSTEGRNITLIGGYTPGFTGRVPNPSLTVLDGGNSGWVIHIYNYNGGDIAIQGFTVQNGNSPSDGGGIYARSYAPKGDSGHITIVNNHVLSNVTIDNGGGGIAASSYSIQSAAGNILIYKNRIHGNSARYAGGIKVELFSQYGTTGNIAIKNNIITKNTASSEAGGIYTGDWFDSLVRGDITLVSNTIADNEDGETGGTVNLFMRDTNTCHVYNNICWGNSDNYNNNFDIRLSLTGTANGYNNCYNSLSYGTWTNSGGNIHTDPRFIADGNYHLQSLSPCIDTGTNQAPGLPDYDFDGNPRILYSKFDGTPDTDMGAYEYLLLPLFHGHDFDGNSISDIAVWRPSSGSWFIKGVGNYVWGALGDIPVNGDYKGDGMTDIAVWRPSNGRWYIKDIGGAVWGMSEDIPVPGDYDGDGITDISVWRPSSGRWYIKGIGNYIWGTLGDIPLNGDFDGDGITDIAVWRPSNGKWFIRGSGGPYWGMPDDIPVPADYNGDGITDIAVWRPSNGRWYIQGIGGTGWGALGDMPTPGDFNGDGITDIAIWRTSEGKWYLKTIGSYVWGLLGDVPLVR